MGRRHSLVARLAVPLVLLHFAACGGPPPPPKPPARELRPPAATLLARVPSDYGSPTPIALPDDQGSAAAQAAFAGMAGGRALHEPSLDLVAAVVGRTYAEAAELPADALLQWLFWKCGATSLSGSVNVLVAPADAEPYFEEQIRRLATALPASGTAFSFGVARTSFMGYVAQAITLAYRPVEVAPITKNRPPNATVPVRITPKKPYANLTLYVDQGGPNVLPVPMRQETDGSFYAEATLPPAPGRYFVEVVGVDVPPDGAVEKGWRVSLLWLPLYAGVPEPAAPDEFIRRPKKNPGRRSAWMLEVLNAYNDERARLERPPLAFEEGANLLAQQRSDEYAGMGVLPPPELGLYGKLADAGLPARNLFGYVDQIEYVSEYITLRLMRPAARYALLDPGMSTLALGLSQRSVQPGLGLWSSVEYVFEQIRVDPPMERERLLRELDADEIAAGGKAFERSEALSRAAQGVVDEVCRGGPKPTDAKAIFARAGGLSASLRRRVAVPWLGYDLSKEEIASIHEKVKRQGYTHAGVGVCQGTIDGRKGAVMVLTLVAGP